MYFMKRHFLSLLLVGGIAVSAFLVTPVEASYKPAGKEIAAVSVRFGGGYHDRGRYYRHGGYYRQHPYWRHQYNWRDRGYYGPQYRQYYYDPYYYYYDRPHGVRFYFGK